MVEGIMLDIIINFYVILFCMIIVYLVECLFFKVVIFKGLEGDVIFFMDVMVDLVFDLFCEQGYQFCGFEILYYGYIGCKFWVQCFFGFIYYQCFRYMVDDKIYVCVCGLVQIMICQLVEGCVRDGGFCFGEMECDCMIVYGVVLFLKECLFEVFDVYCVYICEICGLMMFIVQVFFFYFLLIRC